MSGGEYNYVYAALMDLEGTIQRQDIDPRRAAFAKLMGLMGQAMRDIEWVDSCDKSPGDEHEAIDKVFAFLKADPATIAKAKSFDSLKLRLETFFDMEV